MAVRIRLSRGGSKKRPFYRVVAADQRAPRDGRFIEKLGTYNPLLPQDHEQRLVINEERVKYWLGVGAQPTERLEKLFIYRLAKQYGIVQEIKKPVQFYFEKQKGGTGNA